MSGSRPTPVEQHLGDRLAALVDGELGHEARERVLSHLATCCKCKAEADAQRRLKSVFATAAPPPPSESFLARLQGLPAAGPEGPTGSGSGFGAGPPFGSSADFGMAPGPFRYAPVTPAGPDEPRSGFRIHDLGRAEAERSASRGRRFAFAAAGAVSLAALALGGVAAGTPVDTTERAGGGKSNVTPLRTQAGTGQAAPDSRSRRGGSPPAFAAQGETRSGPREQVGDAAPRHPGTPPLLEELEPYPYSAALLKAPGKPAPWPPRSVPLPLAAPQDAVRSGIAAAPSAGLPGVSGLSAAP
ncbi:zf-HC2 domain-containing protein [Streptomyces albidoflavus]|uniref:zf-HC2 domain-containing protein n=1 Tax=Streptomyces sp. DR3-1 TaxID=2951169 RepID=UPI002042C61D|nr:zf-HC2 domain-containing protein [Streptomyces sp. DR3-1]MCM3816717.1 zf-HC2 domain-containing protein [Streptomyces sp. DR3-1]